MMVGIPPTWPSSGHWLHLIHGPSTSSEALRAFVTAHAAREQFARNADRVLTSWTSRSAILGLWNERKLARSFERWVELEQEYIGLLPTDVITDSSRGQETEAALAESVACWSDSSRLMEAICQSQGIQYLHLLQPTLHDPGSKLLSAEEQEQGVGKGGFSPLVERGYELLRAEGAELRRKGVPFVDTSRIFADVSETLYYDRAHFGRAGNLILADHIVTELLNRLRSGTAPEGQAAAGSTR